MVELKKDVQLRERVRMMPKIELHRHFEGSLRLATMLEVARRYSLDMPPYDAAVLRPLVQMMPEEDRNMQHFLAKFDTLRQFYRSADVVKLFAREIVEDAANDNVKYMELRFTPRALSNITQDSSDTVVAMVCETVREAAAKHDIDVRLIVSMNRHEGVEIGRQTIQAAVAHRDKGVVGVDLAGNEEEYPASPFRDLFKEAKAAGLGITVHAGEWAGPYSIWDAVGNLGADRIGHGIRVLEDPAIASILIEREIVLEVCPRSNYLSGVVDRLAEHPLPRLMRHNLLTTINTDDPSVCDVTLSDEMVDAIEHMDLSFEDLKKNTLYAARAAFLPPPEREALVARFQEWLSAS